MEDHIASYVKTVASKSDSRKKTRERNIDTMQSFALLRNETREHVKTGLYFLISRNYKVLLKRTTKGKQRYQISTEDKKILCSRSMIHENSKALKALFNGDSYSITCATLFRLCIALCLSFDEAYDWFLSCGFDLSSDTQKCRSFAKLLSKYCEKDGHTCDMCTVHEKLQKADCDAKNQGLGVLYPHNI